MNAISLRGVTKHFKKQTVRREYTTIKTEVIRWLKRQRKAAGPTQHIEALKGIDLDIPKGSTVGIIGRNGSGKSTLLKLITGIYSPTAGQVDIKGRISALLDLGAGFHPDFTGRENILINGIILGMSRSEVKARVPEIIAFAELGDFIDEPVRTYSSGMFMRLAFAVATHVDPEILIIDEILAVGDEHFQKKSMQKMMDFRSSGRTIVLVSHDLGAVQQWCDLAAWIDGGRIRLFGPPDMVVGQYRSAVKLAEDQAAATGDSALSAPGRALPEVPAAEPAFGPRSGSGQRRGTFRLELEQVALLSPEGGERSRFGPDDRLEVELRFVAKEAIANPAFTVEVLRHDGLSMFGMRSGQDGVDLPPLDGRGTVRLVIDRLGLGPGKFQVVVRAEAGDEVLDEHRGYYPLVVEARGESTGLMRPSHRWTVQTGSGQQPTRLDASRRRSRTGSA